MQQLAQFLAATGRRLRTLGKVSATSSRRESSARSSLSRSRFSSRSRCPSSPIGAGANDALSWPARRAFSYRHGGTRTIAALSFLPEQIEEQTDCFLFPPEMMNHHLSLGSDAAPFPKQADVPEEVRFDRHRIVAGHVPRGIGAFDIKMVGLRDHEKRIVDLGNPVQRHL